MRSTPQFPNFVECNPLQEGNMRVFCFCLTILLVTSLAGMAQQGGPASGPLCKLTVLVEGVNDQDGNIGVLVFNSDKGWPDDRVVALRDVVVPAHSGTVTVEIPNLPAGDYAVALIHDVNKNHKLDKNWMGKPTEQWGMSNNPHATIKTPSFSTARFSLQHDMELHVKMQM
jgi:uncharacterized protein (DUF2141 family)